MHVEISVAMNFFISYLYNKLPRRRVDLFCEELESGLKDKFRGHWYPEAPSKGSGYRCIKGNGEEIDPVIVAAAVKAGLDIVEIKSYLPEDLTLWIDPCEVSYKIGEKGQVKLLYSDRNNEDGCDNMDREVQAANRTFNPEAQTFTPELPTVTPELHTFTPDILAFTPDVMAFCADSSQSFQPIDSLSSSLSNLSLSPSSPVPPSAWSTATSPSSNLFSSAAPAAGVSSPSSYLTPRANGSGRPQFTAAMFAQTKFGSTKLKTHVKRPNRLSPTEFSNYFRQQQKGYSGAQRPRSLSPRDPRVEFLIDKQQRMMFQQQVSPLTSYGPKLQQHFLQHQHHRQQLSPTSMYPDFIPHHSSGVSSCTSSPHLSPHLSPRMSPQCSGSTFQELIHSTPNLNNLSFPSSDCINRSSSLSHLGRSLGFPSLKASSVRENSSSFPDRLAQANSLSPDGRTTFVDSLTATPVHYANSLQHLLVAN
ncbi:unnamed protein product [Candidula unifasciata]|uniref:Anti-proliferative protein domain-containing protein n=1 Tax=Candidula unifasciata TaxID=100452 RepID=A0A8S3ZLQ9_9EUPU|nr:unnamed protein product [Candidula unifasciata]